MGGNKKGEQPRRRKRENKQREQKGRTRNNKEWSTKRENHKGE